MSSEGSYRIEFPEVAGFVDDLTRFARNVDDRMRALELRITDLHLAWTGEGANAHRSAHGQWREGATEIRDAIIDIRRAADHSHNAFRDLQDHQRTMWP
ncbi:WXG100 family type VII secretion target [Gordonia sp. zg691]|uniref:WXG100 family type VII secretion target n=1 Tax=Gordonia jinghuaiqii TaxID=2758710 RepID=UPI0016624BA0|nr:WXG100 family type VII secretion target [Gordonia jinghuaiqii]MBD0862470.1 WXG100 family type VII secretion target [Gordonia jinghuaiqii]